MSATGRRMLLILILGLIVWPARPANQHGDWPRPAGRHTMTSSRLGPCEPSAAAGGCHADASRRMASGRTAGPWAKGRRLNSWSRPVGDLGGTGTIDTPA